MKLTNQIIWYGCMLVRSCFTYIQCESKKNPPLRTWRFFYFLTNR